MKKLLIYFSIALIATSCINDPGKKGNLNVIAIFATPIEESWDGVIHKALQKAEADGIIIYKYIDNVQPQQFEKELRNKAAQNYDIIFGDAFSAEDIVRRVARDYPDITFVFGSGLGPSSPNLSVFDNWIHEPAYLAGMIAGHITESNKIGVVGGFDIPEVNRLINAFKKGALEINPDVKVKITFIGAWFNPTAANQAAKVLISKGVDVIYAERDGVINACAEAKIPVFGNLLDQHKQSPDYVVTSILWNMEPTVNHVLKLVASNSFEPENYAGWSMMAKGGASLAPFNNWETKLDEEIKSKVSNRTEAIISGRFRVPIDESKPISD